jgi:hypothetical protein
MIENEWLYVNGVTKNEAVVYAEAVSSHSWQ